MDDKYYKLKYSVKKELRTLRANMEEEKEVLQIKLDNVERERDNLAEKIEQDFRTLWSPILLNRNSFRFSSTIELMRVADCVIVRE
jgi:septation ring formation regulator EzrA